MPSAKKPPINREKNLPTRFCITVKQTKTTIAIHPLIINVAGAYTKYPKSTSANADPSPAARKPYPEESVHPAKSTAQSPKFKYPFNGDGILITNVATHEKAAIKAANTIFLVLECIFIFSPLQIDTISIYYI